MHRVRSQSLPFPITSLFNVGEKIIGSSVISRIEDEDMRIEGLRGVEMSRSESVKSGLFFRISKHTWVVQRMSYGALVTDTENSDVQ